MAFIKKKLSGFLLVLFVAAWTVMAGNPAAAQFNFDGVYTGKVVKFSVVLVLESGKFLAHYYYDDGKGGTKVFRFLSPHPVSHERPCDTKVNKSANAVAAFKNLLPKEFSAKAKGNVIWSRNLPQEPIGVYKIKDRAGADIAITLYNAQLFCPPK